MNVAEYKTMLVQQEKLLVDLQDDMRELDGIQARMDVQHPDEIYKTVQELVVYMVKTKREAIVVLQEHMHMLREMVEG